MFRALFEGSLDAIWLSEPTQGILVDCNQAAVDLLGARSKAELLQTHQAKLAPPFQPDGRSSAEKAEEFAQWVSAHGSLRFEWLLRRFDGQEVSVEVMATPEPESGLHVVALRDVSERKRTENALRENQQLLTSIVDNLSEAIWRSGPDHELVFANRAYLRMSGYDSLEEMQRLPRERLYARPADRARLLDLLARNDGFHNQEIEYIRRDGQHWWGLTNSVAVRDPRAKAVLYYVGSVADITERKRTQQELLELNATLERRIAHRTNELVASEARLRTLVEHAPEAIVVFDGDTGRFLSGNAHACRLYGFSAEELTRQTPAEVSPELQPNGRRSAELAREKIDEALAGGTPVFEWIHRHTGGRLIPTEVRLVRLPAKGTNLLRASIIDNTERKRREQVQAATFQISEAVHKAGDLADLYRQIHEVIKELMPAENFYIAQSEPGAGTFDFPYFVDERDPKPGALRLTEGLTGYVLRTGQALLANGRNIQHLEDGQAIVAEPGRELCYTESGAPAAVWLGAPLITHGRTFGVVAVQNYQDPEAYGEEEKRILTFVAGQVALAIERKRSEEQLRESEHEFRALFEASSQGVMLFDYAQYLEVNLAAARILGYHSGQELVGKHPRDSSPPTQPNGESSETLIQQHYARCLKEGSTRYDWVARRPDGSDVPLEVILTRVAWRGRHIIQAAINDISERKRAEDELLNSLAREKELSQLKSSFVSMVSHEFRTPLGVILSSAEILEAYLDQLDPAERREQLRSIQKNSRRMARLMEEVLVLGMAEAGKLDFKAAPLDLVHFCRRVVDEVLSATDEKCPVGLIVAVEAREALADERLLQHIFTNLLSNAVKYSPPGNPVDWEIVRDGVEAVCRILDRGAGIPESDLARIFQAFHRGANVAQISGTGLGLTIVKRCVELHRGKISIESAVGQGTTVTVRLPVFTEPQERKP